MPNVFVVLPRMIIGLFFFRSTGATVVEMLTKSPPWHNLTDFQVMFRISIKEAPTYQLHSDISKQAQEFLDLIFTYDSLQRPSAMELIEHRWLSHSKGIECYFFIFYKRHFIKDKLWLFRIRLESYLRDEKLHYDNCNVIRYYDVSIYT